MSPQNVLVHKTSTTDINRLQDFFWNYNIRFEYKEQKNEQGRITRGTFTISSEVKVSVSIVGDYENAQIAISAKNMEGFKDTKFRMAAERVDDAFLEEFSGALIGYPWKLSADATVQ